MSAIETAARPETSNSSGGIRAWIKRHPLVAFFVFAYAGAWIFESPILVSQRGVGLLALPDALLLLLFILSTFAGPLPAALIVTGVVEGKPGVRQLLRRMVQWRVGLAWYLIPILGYPLIYVIAYTPVSGAGPFSALFQNWPLLLSAYLPAVVIGLIFPSLGEEPGWRGFALPRLQLQYGALAGTLILGTLHAFWHLPVYFIPGAIVPGAFDPTVFVSNTLSIIAASFLWTWIFNNAGGSVFIAMLVHSASNANSGFLPLLGFLPDDPWATFKILAVCALLVIVLTRGRLSYQPNNASEPAAHPAARASEISAL